jgi:hypothetical protein
MILYGMVWYYMGNINGIYCIVLLLHWMYCIRRGRGRRRDKNSIVDIVDVVGVLDL